MTWAAQPEAPISSDEELFEAHRAGDPAAFAEIVRRWTPALRRLLASAGTPSEVDELVQDVFLHLHRSRADFRRGSPLRPWLLTIAWNLRRESVRRRARRSRLAPTTSGADVEAVAGEQRGSAARDAREELEEALAELPQAQRDVIELHWFGELSFAEIAEQVGATVSAVKVRAHRGYEKMRELLGARRSG